MSDSPGNLRRFFRKILLPTHAAKDDLPLRAIDLRAAKEFIKRRLAALYPELQGDAEALERVYRELDLEARGTLRRSNGEVKSYALRLPDELPRPFDRK
ncbi:MAG: hypothetical protein JO295_06335 [Verrucomicrobia bacterium]|nr:hypothetical protein [Verrucomicrobiota bacterium]